MTAEEDFVERLAELDEALAAGQTLSHDASTHHPELKRRLNRGLMALKALNDLRPGSTADSHDSNLDLDRTRNDDAPARIGRFLIIKELGRGGFGVVFLAHDPRLHRPIALKVPHAHVLMNDELRSRFGREAQAAALMDHPNLVPVYEVDDAGPVCFMATAYVEGPTLAEWLSRQPAVASTDAARFVAALAHAVAHAHNRGVVHRDLKPANILLQEKNKTDVTDGTDARPLGVFAPKITDFGLAKLIDESVNLTQSRATMGTPAYMAPEQARGRASDIGPAADIHALGIILYELLTGRTPFRGESDLDTLQMVTSAEPVPPRQLRSGLAGDLNTICLKCLEKNTSRRYGSAQQLAQDLERFLEGRPILARPVGFTGRLIRWCRRKPVIAGLAVSLMAAIGLGAAGIAREYARANRERADAVEARDRTDRLLGQARNSLGEMITVGHQLTHGPDTSLQGQEILTVARRYHQVLLDEDPNNAAIRSQALTICRRLALITGEGGDWSQANSAWIEAAQHAEQLLASSDGNDYRAQFVDLMNNWGEQLFLRNQFAQLVEATGRAEPLARALAVERPNDIGAAQILVSNLYWRAAGLRKTGRWPEAVALLHEALATIRRHGKSFRERCSIGFELNCLNQLSEGYDANRQFAEAEQTARTCVELMRSELAQRPADADLQMQLSSSLIVFGRVLFSTGQWQAAVDTYRESNRLFAQHPEQAAVVGKSFQARQRNANAIAGALSRLKKLDEAYPDVLFAVQLPPPTTARAGSLNPTPPELFENYVRLVDILTGRGEFELARKAHGDAMKRLPANAENDPLLKRWVAELSKRAPSVKAATGEPP